MAALDTLERKGLFTLTRVLALLLVSGLLLVAAIGTLWIASTFSKDSNSKITAAEVLKPDASTEAITSTEQNRTEQQDSTLLRGVKLPFVLQKHFADEKNRAVLGRNLEDLSAEEQQEYVDNLAEVVSAAESRGADIVGAMNKYFELKRQRLGRARLEQAERKQTRLYMAGAVVSTLTLIALFSLILVLLSIERNTRPSIIATGRAA